LFVLEGREGREGGREGLAAVAVAAREEHAETENHFGDG